MSPEAQSNLDRLAKVTHELNEQSELAAALNAVTIVVNIFEALPDAVILADPLGRIALANSRAEELTGYFRRDLIGHPVEKLLPERLREAHRAHRERYAQAPMVRPMRGNPLLLLHADGREIPVEISLGPLTVQQSVYVVTCIRPKAWA